MVPNTTPLWLFDLDNTLHNASHAIFPAINANMNVFMERVLKEQGLPSDEEAVNALRQRYWRLYGATLLGMVQHHQVLPDDFLREAHHFDDLFDMIRAERGLLNMLKRLPGRKILLTNAPLRYSRDVVRYLGLHRHFDQHISIESMRVHRQLKPKPSRQMLRKLLARERVAAHRCVLVEDTPANLKSAKELGLRTAWVTQYLTGNPHFSSAGVRRMLTMHPSYVDVKVRSVRQLTGHLRRLVARA
ncbi:pyrimidine 5'-nucleotidase [Herbaspirillum sp. CF444]|uniref:pyrimidine 5'-nucleotidase n=1 Tax=Herbaspirillum sp. CF444 TaxID=1144319 RepID=UPI000A2F30F7|nr:pyrimidine 5'-nucleotidase [Herbaspirillum sp. CF444]